MPLYPQSVVSQGACIDSLLFRCFHFTLSFGSIKELGSASICFVNIVKMIIILSMLQIFKLKHKRANTKCKKINPIQ
jgi:hypothetical protein